MVAQCCCSVAAVARQESGKHAMARGRRWLCMPPAPVQATRRVVAGASYCVAVAQPTRSAATSGDKTIYLPQQSAPNAAATSELTLKRFTLYASSGVTKNNAASCAYEWLSVINGRVMLMLLQARRYAQTRVLVVVVERERRTRH